MYISKDQYTERKVWLIKEPKKRQLDTVMFQCNVKKLIKGFSQC